MTDDHRPQQPDPCHQVDATSPSPGASDWSDGANWADPRTRTTGTAPAVCDYAITLDEVYIRGETLDTTGGVG